jgi:diguanylate cyclase (GGDEF)-like protein
MTEVLIKPSKVLVVDDDITARILAQQALTLDGFKVYEATDGLNALERFQEVHPDIVILDIEMPELNGYEVCRQIRQLPFGKRVPILMATGFNDMSSVNRAYDAGATDFVTKPFNWKVLGQRLRYMIRASVVGEELNELKKSERRLANAQRIAKLGNWEWDVTSNELYWSDHLFELLNSKRGKIQPSLTAFFESIPEIDHFKVRYWFNRIVNGKPNAANSIHHRIIVNDDHRIVKHQIEAEFDEDGELVLLSGAVLDVTELRQAQDKILELASYDALTGLHNRSVFSSAVDRAIKRAQKFNHTGAVLFLDLDNFKRINDTFGHGVGDLLLKVVAKRLTKSARASDRNDNGESNSEAHLISRFGGDEFTILIPHVKDASEAKVIADRILDNIGRRVSLAGHELVITPSIGIALFPQDGTEVESLLKNVDAAMYHVKHGGKNSYEMFAHSMNIVSKRRLQIEAHLRHAIDNKELYLVYQPQISLHSGKIIGVEALLRWDSPLLGAVSPVEFIPVAEETGLITPIGEWVLFEACQQAQVWRDEALPPVRMAVNLSVRQFARQNLESVVQSTLLKTGLPVRYLELEITENMLMDDVEGSVDTLHRLKDLGVCLAIDDFGTGYSSLSYLKRFPIDRLKIDRSFITHVTTNTEDASVTQAIIAVAHSLGLSVTAEGVESADQLAFLNENKCEEVQGYYFSKPVSANDIKRLLIVNQGLPDS